MTSQAKINANRCNAQKSTGPKTEEGKAIVSQNAVTHGLTSRYDVLSFENAAEYEQYRTAMLAELEPAGAVETMLAQRIVSLTWRMQRADRLQGAAMEYLFTAEERRGHFTDDPSSDQVYRLTSSLVRDCANYRVVERLAGYEKRLENSYHKTMAELLRWRKMCQASSVETQDVASPSSGGETKPNVADEAEETPCGVTTNGETAAAAMKTQVSTLSAGPDQAAKQSQMEVPVETQDVAFPSLPTKEIASLRSQ